MHVDVIYLGKSGASHEIDVSICDRTEAEAVRALAGTLPRSTKLRAAVECKSYDCQLGTSLGRTFVGLVADCGDLEFKAFVTNGRSEQLAAYFSPARRPQGFYAISPLVPEHRDRFVSVLEQVLRQWAKVS